jgi:hypothetical protein
MTEPSSVQMNWQPIALILPAALLLDAMVVYTVWMAW